MTGLTPDIAHVVVLMLENRSFDSMLGWLYPGRPDFDELTGNERNQWNGNEYRAWSSAVMTPDAACIPTPDPAEQFVDMVAQIHGIGQSRADPATMSGFVANYMAQTQPAGSRDPAAVMHGFTPDQLPVLSTLARAFGVSDRWHASAPNQTWPNRFFAHTGTGGGFVNNTPLHLYTMPTIYNRLTEAQRSWRIYCHDAPQSAALSAIWSELPDHLRFFEDDFAADAAAGRLPNYSFIEPRYFPEPMLGRMPNDQHPPHNVTYGERLIARVYDAVRHGPGWARTLLIITYDEHGGTYDHVPPPAAVPPDADTPDGVVFDQFGVRVPAVIVSPFVPAGSIIRPPAASRYPFDHTSILATLRALFDLRAPLTARDAAAPDLLHALSLPAPSNNGPDALAIPAITPTLVELVTAHAAPPNHMQQALALMATRLPAGVADVPVHAGALATGHQPFIPPLATVEHAFATVRDGLRRFLDLPAAPPP